VDDSQPNAGDGSPDSRPEAAGSAPSGDADLDAGLDREAAAGVGAGQEGFDAERWGAAVHEAGHAVAMLALADEAGTPPRLVVRAAVADPGRGGVSWTPAVGPDYEVQVTIAGLVAEGLADELPLPPADQRIAPRRRRPSDADTNPFGIPPFSREEDEAWVRQGRAGMSDWRKVALWAIHGHEEDPETWPRRVAELRARVEGLLRKHLSALAAAAAVLYRDGGFVAGSLDKFE